MKKIEIKTEKATLLVVDFSLDRGKSIAEALLCNPISGNKEFEGYELLGKPSDITEEEWNGIVDTGVDFVKETTHFIDYEDESSLYRSAIQSGLSLLKANGILLENPLGVKPMNDEIISKNLIKQGYGSNDFVDVLYDLHQYESAQEIVWANPHIFVKID